VPIKANWLSFF